MAATLTTARIETSGAIGSVPDRRPAYNAAILVGFLAFAYLQVFVLPAVAPMPGMDSTIFLAGAARMARGQAIYRDFFELTYPGTDLYYAAWMKVVGARAWIAALTMVALAATSAWLTLQIARRALRNEAGALLAGLATLSFPLYLANDATHRWFSTVFVLAAAWTALRETRRSAVAAGALCAGAAFFTQTTGLLMMVALCGWLMWRRSSSSKPTADSRKAPMLAAASFAVVLTLLCGYFVVQAGPRVFWYSTVTFVLTHYGSVWWNSGGAYMHALPSRSWDRFPELLAWMLVHAVVPLAYILFAVRYARRRNKDDERWPALMLVEATGIALFLAVAKAPSEKRLAMGSMPAIILLVWMLYENGRIERALRQVFWAVTLVALVAGPVLRQRQWHGTLDTPTGRVAFASRDMYEMVRWLTPRTHPGELCFGHPPLEFVLGLKSAAYIPYANGGEYTPPEQVERLLSELSQQQEPLVLVSAMAYMPQPNSPDYLAPFRSYLSANYRLVNVLGGATEVWVRKGVEFPQ